MIAAELFAGPGGWSLGHRYARPDDVSVGFEWDSDACRTARAAGFIRVEADVATINPSLFFALLGVVEYLHASPPCQGFSLAGKGEGRLDADRLIATILSLAEIPEEPALVEDAMEGFNMLARDPRSVLTLEPIRWVSYLQPEFITLEQVPSVQPIWDAYAVVLRAWGYSVWTGVLRTEQYGVPQTRRRAILLARRGDFPVAPPAPTHSRYYERDRERLDAGVEPWVSMAEALGWGDSIREVRTSFGTPKVDGVNGTHVIDPTERPSHTVTTKVGGWALRSNYGTGGDASKRGERTSDEPAATVTTKTPAGASWVATGQNSRAAGGTTKRYRRPTDVPSPTVTSQTRSWRVEDAEEDLIGGFAGAGASVEASSGQRPRRLSEPAHTITGGNNAVWVPPSRVNNQSGTDFDVEALAETPATVVQGRDIIPFRGATANRTNGSSKSRNDGFRVTVEEAGVLQSFPEDFPWTGNKTKQHEQVGNAVPPFLAAALVAALVGGASRTDPLSRSATTSSADSREAPDRVG